MIGNRVVAALAVAAIACLAACTGSSSPTAPTGSSSASPTATGAAVAKIDAAWTASPGRLWQPPARSTTPQFWTTNTSVIVPLKAGLTSYAADSGRRQWHLALPANLCAIADAPNDKGIAAVLMGRGSGYDRASCAMAGAVDTSTGKLLWTTSIEHRSSYGFSGVAVGPKAVAVTNPCDGALSLSVADGSTLVDRTPSGGGCYDSYASDGRVLVDGHDDVNRAALVGYDAVTGRRLWRAPLHGNAAQTDVDPAVDRVVSSDPLVVDARIDSHRFLQRIDTGRGTASALGRESSDTYPAGFVRRVGADLLVQYDETPLLFDYDIESGREVHETVLGADENAVGLRGGKVISVRTSGSGALVVASTSPASGARQVLASMSLRRVSDYSDTGNTALVGNTMVVAGTGSVTGFALPATGVAADSLPDPTQWAAKDIRPDTVADLCTGLSVATRRELGFVYPAEATPADCNFVELQPGGNEVQLSISTTTSAPESGTSATKVARSVLAGLSKSDPTAQLPAATPVNGIGDQAFEASADADQVLLVNIFARRANVTVAIRITGDGRSGAVPTLAQLRQGARLAAKDMIATIDRRR